MRKNETKTVLRLSMDNKIFLEKSQNMKQPFHFTLILIVISITAVTLGILKPGSHLS